MRGWKHLERELFFAYSGLSRQIFKQARLNLEIHDDVFLVLADSSHRCLDLKPVVVVIGQVIILRLTQNNGAYRVLEGEVCGGIFKILKIRHSTLAGGQCHANRQAQEESVYSLVIHLNSCF